MVKNRKIGRKPDRRMPVPTSRERIVLTGLVHMEAGKSLGRELAFCTDDQNGTAFFLGPEDMQSPDGDEGLAALCYHCESEAGEAERHWVIDLRTALFDGRVDTAEGALCLPQRFLLRNLAEAHGTGPVAMPAAARKAATS
jgi:hypothetical protein